MKTRASHAILASLLSVALVSSPVLAQPRRPARPAAPPAPAQPPPAPAQPPPPPTLAESLTGAAKADYDAAHILYRNGDYANALTKFQAAYDKSKDPRLFW